MACQRLILQLCFLRMSLGSADVLGVGLFGDSRLFTGFRFRHGATEKTVKDEKNKKRRMRCFETQRMPVLGQQPSNRTKELATWSTSKGPTRVEVNGSMDSSRCMKMEQCTGRRARG